MSTPSFATMRGFWQAFWRSRAVDAGRGHGVLMRSIARPLERARDLARSIAVGNLDNVLPTHGRDEVGQLVDALGKMQDSLRERRTADERTLGRERADQECARQVHHARHDRRRRRRHPLHERVPGRDDDGRGGGHPQGAPGIRCQDAHRPQLRRVPQESGAPANLLSSLRATHRAEIKVAAAHVLAHRQPHRRCRGAVVGTVVEWRDRTEEVEVEREVAASSWRRPIAGTSPGASAWRQERLLQGTRRRA